MDFLQKCHIQKWTSSKEAKMFQQFLAAAVKTLQYTALDRDSLVTLAVFSKKTLFEDTAKESILCL